MSSNPASPDVFQSAGGLIWRQSAKGKRLAVIHRPQHDDWTLPKGKLEPGESWRQAALREAFEETGCQVVIETFAGCVCYMTNKAPKVVLFWNMKAIEAEQFHANKEVDQLQWLTAEEAIVLLSYQDERELVLNNISAASSND